MSGNLNLVITDPNKPTSYEQRFEGTLPCTVLVLGAQFADPPAPTEVSSVCSEAQPSQPAGGTQTAPGYEACERQDGAKPSQSELCNFDSGWKAEQAERDAVNGIPTQHGPPVGEDSKVEPSLRLSRHPPGFFAAAYDSPAAAGNPEGGSPGASSAEHAEGAAATAATNTPPGPSRQKRAVRPEADEPLDAVLISDSPVKSAPEEGSPTPAERVSGLGAPGTSNTPAKLAAPLSATGTPAKFLKPEGPTEASEPSAKRRWTLRPEYGGPAKSGYSEHEAALATERRGLVSAAEASQGCIFRQLGQDLQSASMVLRTLADQ